MITTFWQATANQGDVIYLEAAGRRIPHLMGEERAEAISLWEGIAGYSPPGRIAGWRWRRGLHSLRKQIIKAVQLAMAERDRLSA